MVRAGAPWRMLPNDFRPVVERTFAWTARVRRLARDHERLPTTLAGLHFIAVATLMLQRVASLFTSAQHPLESALVRAHRRWSRS